MSPLTASAIRSPAPALLIAPLFGYLAIEHLPIQGVPLLGDFLWLSVAMLIGFLLGFLHPGHWWALALSSAGLDLVLFGKDILLKDLTLWPIGLAFRLAWLGAALTGAALGRAWGLRSLRRTTPPA